MTFITVIMLFALAFLSYFVTLLCERGAMKSEYEPRKSRFQKAQRAFVWASIIFCTAFIASFVWMLARLAM